MRTAKAFAASIALGATIIVSTAAGLPLLAGTLGFSGWPDSPLMELMRPDCEVEPGVAARPPAASPSSPDELFAALAAPVSPQPSGADPLPGPIASSPPARPSREAEPSPRSLSLIHI